MCTNYTGLRLHDTGLFLQTYTPVLNDYIYASFVIQFQFLLMLLVIIIIVITKSYKQGYSIVKKSFQQLCRVCAVYCYLVSCVNYRVKQVLFYCSCVKLVIYMIHLIHKHSHSVYLNINLFFVGFHRRGLTCPKTSY